MNKTPSETDARRGGFFRNTLACVNDKQGGKFGLTDALELLVLVTGIVLVMRYILR